MCDDFVTGLAEMPGATEAEPRADGWWMTAPSLDVVALAQTMGRMGFRLSAMTGCALPNGETEVLYHYCSGQDALNARVQTQGNCLPSIAPITPSANWAEREIHDLYAVDFAGHPGLDRLLRPAEFAPGLFRNGS